MTVTESLQRFTILSIGDGLVSQIPALITSTAAGILVTRAASKNDLGQELGRQLLFYPRAMTVLAVMMGVFALVPGLPMLPFLVLAVIAGMLAYTLHHHGPPRAGPGRSDHSGRARKAPQPRASAGSASPARRGSQGLDKLENLLPLDPLQIELGYGLVSLADKRKGGDLLDRVTGVRRTFAQEMGVIIPPIRLRDNLQLGANEYRFLLKGNPVAQGRAYARLLAGHERHQQQGRPQGRSHRRTRLPTARHLDHRRRTQNRRIGGYTVVDAASVLVTHLSETVQRQCHEILSRQDVQVLLDNLKQTHPTVVNELMPAQLTVGQVQRILQNLLAEGISIRNLAGILEKVSDYAALTKNPDELSEYARRALGPQITRPTRWPAGASGPSPSIRVWNNTIAQGVRQSPTEVSLVMEPGLARHLIDTLSQIHPAMLAAGHPPVVLCAPQIRLAFRRFFESTFADLAVIAYSEIPPQTEIQNASTIPSAA